MKKTFLFVILICFSFATISNAQEAQTASKIAVIDIQKIMRESAAAKSAHTQIEKKKQEFQAEINKQESSLQKEDKDLAEQRSVLSSDAFEKKKNTFKNKVNEVQRKVQTRTRQLEEAYAKALTEIQSSVLKITADLAKQKGFSIAIPTQQILYADPTMNISEDVLKELDKQLPSVNIKIEDKEPAKAKEKKAEEKPKS